MKLRRWVTRRGPDFIRRRAGALLSRYGLTPARSEARIRATVSLLAKYGCAPTFPTPARVLQWHPRFIRSLQDAGAEIAVHNFDHVDMKGYTPAEGRDQLLKAAATFERYGIEVCGFRCPYLSWSEGLLSVLPEGRFGYSSNEAMWWDAAPLAGLAGKGPILETLYRFYEPRSSAETPSVPRQRSGLVEIPVCIPDDLQLYDGLQLSTEEVIRAWSDILLQIHKRGELFTLMFHPELAERCDEPLKALLELATTTAPGIWLARLRDIADWWREKATFSADIEPNAGGWQIAFKCTSRATIVAKGLGKFGAGVPWMGDYYLVPDREIDVQSALVPLVGVPAGTSEATVTFLREQGYIVRVGEGSQFCAISLQADALARLKTEMDLISYVEGCPGPLVRYWRWPSGAGSALSVTGDLDALTLVDYAPRLWVR